MQSRAATPLPPPRSLVAGCAGFYADAHHGVVSGCTRAASGGGAAAVTLARSSRAALASMLARTTAWCEAAPVQPQAAAPLPSPCSLVASCAGFHAGAHHGWCEAAPVQSQAAAPRPPLCWFVAGAPACVRHVCGLEVR